MTIVPNIRRLDGKKRHNTTVTGKTFMATLLLPLQRGFQRFTILMRSDATLRTEISGQVENPVYRCHLAYSVTGVFYFSRY